jgi:hypothetical protein
VWRDGIFFKLVEIIKPQFWIILKDYYDKSDGVLKLNGKLIQKTRWGSLSSTLQKMDVKI